jgi:alpha-tubulin suppressor-like RCC1 family protein
MSAMGIFRFFVCLFLLHLSSASFASEIDLETGLVAHYKFDGDFTDSSGTGNHGDQQGGVSFVEGVNGQAAYFDGNDDLVSVPHHDSLALDQTLTISTWVLPVYRDPNDRTVIMLIKNDHFPNNYSLWTETGASNFWFQQYQDHYGSAQYTFNVPQPILSEDYVNITVVRDVLEVKIYLNGNLVLIEETNYNARLGNSPLTIGGGNTYQKYKGSMDELRIYNRALSESEVIELATENSHSFESKQFSLQELYSTFLPESRSLTLQQDSLDIGPSQSGPHNEVLWRIPVLEEGTLNSEDNFIVQIEIGENRNFGSVDKDLLVGISDGNNFIQFTNNDHTNGGSGAWMIQDSGEFIIETSPHAGNVVGFDRKNYKLNFSFIDNNIDLNIIDLDDVYDDVDLNFSHGPEIFDRSEGFDLLLVANETHENFALRSLSVTYPPHTSQDNTVIDSDSDGIDDGSDSDADNDGLPNGYETANGLNPVDASDAQSDSDMDGLTALEEFTAGTSPTNDDTDRDTLPDGWEVENGRDPLVADYLVSLGYYHTCALDDTGVVCWGRNGDGQTDVPSLSNPSQVFLGYEHSCALDDAGVVCWGQNNQGQNNVPSLSNPSQVSLGYYHSCALDDTGVVCWGWNRDGQTDVPSLSNPTQVSSGGIHTCALDDTGVVCWGYNSHGQTNVPALSNPTKVSLGHHHSCALDDTGVVCWGWNRDGQTDVPSLSNPTQVSAGGSHTCSLDDTGVVCWGLNVYGQNNVPNLINPKNVSLGDHHSCALDDPGVVCWGWNNYGQIDIPQNLIDPDDDGFSSQNGSDAFPLDPTEWVDTDFDGIGNNADGDDDDDGLSDSFELQNNLDPLVANLDIDNDGIANELDTDNDNDGSLDTYDAFPLDANEQIDSDADGVGDIADADNDNDGITNTLDLFPLDALESTDSDGDGVGDNADFFPNSAEYSLDSDLDQMPDAWERKYGLNPTVASDALLDQDNDGLTALEEYEAGTIPLKILDIDANGSFDALTDGLIILRYAFGLRGENLVRSATAGDAMRTDAADVEAYLNSLVPGL